MEKLNTKDAMMRPLTFLRVNTLLNFKEHSLKEYLDHAFYGDINSPLILGHDTNRVKIGNYNFSETFLLDKTHSVKARSTVRPSLKEFNILGNRMYYHLSTFKEIISFKNVYVKRKINKKGETRIESKEYRFDNRGIEINYTDRTFKSLCYHSHTYTQRIRKNGVREYSILFPYSGCELYETYNSKGVCIKSIFHFPYDYRTGYSSIQMNMDKGLVSFYMTADTDSYMYSDIKLPELNDASIVNLYNEYNCFFIDLMLPNNKLFESFQYGLTHLRTLVLERSETAPYDKDVFRNILAQIDENTIKYET